MIEYSNDILVRNGGVFFRWDGSVIPAALVVAVPSSILAALLVYFSNEVEGGKEIRDNIGVDQVKASQLWAALTGTLVFLIGFRTNKAYQRFWDGTTLLHQMWGEWFDAASCLFAFSHLSRNAHLEKVQCFRHTLIRLMSLCHGSALEEISLQADANEGYPCLDLGGLDLESLTWLMKCKQDTSLKFNRVEVIIHMIQVLIVENQDNGVLKIPPPILSRVFQTISRGQVNLANCKKITATLFPFPYAQLITIGLMIFSLLTPIAMSSILQQAHWAFLYNMVPVFGLVALNLVACELEMPFGGDANDLPLEEFQEHMNNSMLMLIRDESDLAPKITKLCKMEYAGIKDATSKKRPKDIIAELGEFPESPKAKEDAVVVPVVPTVVAQPQQPPVPPAPVPAPPVASTANASPTPAQPPGAQKRQDILNQTCEDLVVNASELSMQLGQGVDAFQELMKNTRVLSSQLLRNSEAMCLMDEATSRRRGKEEGGGEMAEEVFVPSSGCNSWCRSKSDGIMMQRPEI